MPGIRRDTVNNPYLNEYVYDIATKLTKEQKKQLNGRYLKALRNSKTAYNFISKSTIEEKIILLSKLGIDFGFYFNLSKQKLNELIKENDENGTNLQLTNSLLSNKVMVVSSREVMQFLGLMASNSHSELWMMNREFFNAGHKMAAFKKSYANPTNNAVKETIIYSKEIAKFSLDAYMTFEFSPDEFGVPKNSMFVLLFLFIKNNYHVEEELIKIHFKPIMTPDKIGQALTKLQHLMFIEKSADSTARKRRFIITGLGRDMVLKFQKKIFNLSNF